MAEMAGHRNRTASLRHKFENLQVGTVVNLLSYNMWSNEWTVVDLLTWTLGTPTTIINRMYLEPIGNHDADKFIKRNIKCPGDVVDYCDSSPIDSICTRCENWFCTKHNDWPLSSHTHGDYYSQVCSQITFPNYPKFKLSSSYSNTYNSKPKCAYAGCPMEPPRDGMMCSYHGPRVQHGNWK